MEKRLLQVELPMTVKTYDIDFMGIVSNISYVRWMEDLRLHMLEVYYPLQKLMAELIVPIISQTHIEFRRPIKMHDQVKGCIWMDKFDASGWVASMEFLVNGKHAASGQQSGVFFNIGTMKPSNPPEGLQRMYDEEQQRL